MGTNVLEKPSASIFRVGDPKMEAADLLKTIMFMYILFCYVTVVLQYSVFATYMFVDTTGK
jgi:hypothetical protein